jgi:hypothetical protein
LQKIAHYRKVLWFSQVQESLETILKNALHACPDVASTKFEYLHKVVVQISERSTDGVGLGLYFTLYSEGRRAATIRTGASAVLRRKAPVGEEFLRTGIMLVIQGNHAAYLADGHTNDGQITALLQRFLAKVGVAEAKTQFGLAPKANHDQIQRLLKRGVKSIDLGVTSFAASVEQINKGNEKAHWLAPIAALGDAFNNAFGKDRTAEEAEAASEIEARIHLGYDGRNANHLIPIVLGQLASSVEDTSSDFKIVTADDAIITHEKLIIKTEVMIEGDDVASVPNSAFSALRNAMDSWKKSGIFGQ